MFSTFTILCSLSKQIYQFGLIMIHNGWLTINKLMLVSWSNLTTVLAQEIPGNCPYQETTLVCEITVSSYMAYFK